MDSKYITWITLCDKVFLFFVLIFVLNEYGLSIFNNDFAKSYLNDFIAPIIILSLTRLFMSLYVNRLYKFSFKQFSFFFVYISVFFEYLLPGVSDRYVADVFDLFAYASGIVVYQFFIHKKHYEFRTNHSES